MGSCPRLGWKKPLAQPVSLRPCGSQWESTVSRIRPQLVCWGSTHLPPCSRKAAYSQASVCKRCLVLLRKSLLPRQTKLEPRKQGSEAPPSLACPQARWCLQLRLPQLACHRPPHCHPGLPSPQADPGCAGGSGCRTGGSRLHLHSFASHSCSV